MKTRATLPIRRLIVVCAPPLPGLGGIETYTAALVREAVRLGYDVTVISSAKRGDAFLGTFLGVPIYRMRALPFVDGRLPLPWNLRDYVRVLALFRARERALVIVQARFYPSSLAFVALARACGLTCAVIDHGAAFLTLHHPILDALSESYERIVTWCERRCAPRFYGVSQASVAWLRTVGIDDAKLAYNGIDAELLSRHARPQPSRTIVFCGRLIAQKGILELLDGFELWTTRTALSARLVVIGDGPLASVVRARVASIPQAAFVGPVDHEAALRLIGDCDLVVSPSTWPEGFCRVTLEAGALGRAVLATAYGGGDGLIEHDISGRTLENVDAVTIAGELEILMADPQQRARLGTTLRERVRQNFVWAPLIERLFENLAASARATACNEPRSHSGLGR